MKRATASALAEIFAFVVLAGIIWVMGWMKGDNRDQATVRR